MYRVMLIDDEKSARKLMSAAVDWEALDMEIVGEAENGIEAINTIDEFQPDIAFVDISMPFMNGIEFTKLATERYPNLVIIIMTAFDEFEYARQCIRLPVFEYMLKPIVRSEVSEVLERVKKLLDERQPDENFPTKKMEPSTIEKIKTYLQENFTDSTINLTSVAQMFGFSSSYLSRKFKQETGVSFIDFLTSCRMEEAMKLAGTNAKMFCTASKVGIPDPNYFGRCFKKYTGISYSEFAASKQK